MKLKNKNILRITIGVALVAGIPFYAACNKAEKENADVVTSQKLVGSDYVILGQYDDEKKYIQLNFDNNLFIPLFEEKLHSSLDLDLYPNNIFIIDEYPLKKEFSAFLEFSILNANTGETYTIFREIEKEIFDKEGISNTIYYIRNGSGENETRTTTCKGKDCKNEKGCTLDDLKTGCTPCVEGTCEVTDTYTTTNNKTSWTTIGGWAVAVLVAIIAIL